MDNKETNNNYLKEVGDRVLKCRNKKFLSRNELSKMADVPISNIIKMEKGKEAIGFDDVVKICKSLGYSLEYILKGECGVSEIIKMNLKMLDIKKT